MLVVLGLCLWFFHTVWILLELALAACLLVYRAALQLAPVELPRGHA